MKHSLVPPLECCHADTCLPDYWSGHHLAHISIPVHNKMSLSDIKQALHSELNCGAIAGSDMRTRDNSGEIGDVWYYRAHAAINAIKASSRRPFKGLEDQEEDSDYSVYAYFVFKDR